MHVLLHFSPPSHMRMPSPSLLSSNRERVPRAPPQQLPRNTFPSARTRVLTRNGFAEIRGRVVLLCVPVPRLAHSAARNRGFVRLQRCWPTRADPVVAPGLSPGEHPDIWRPSTTRPPTSAALRHCSDGGQW